jgi:V/A-type H+-transporting ATPase subunit I
MLQTERMKRVLVVGTMKALPSTIDVLYDVGAFHVIDFKDGGDTLEMGSPLPGSEEASAKLLKMMAVSQSLAIGDCGLGETSRLSPEKIACELDPAMAHLELEISSEVHARKEIAELLLDKRTTLSTLRPFSHLDFPISSLRGYASIAVFSGRFKTDPRMALSEVTDVFDVIDGEATLVIADKAMEREVADALARCGYTEMPLPPIDGMPSVEIQRLVSEIGILEDKLRAIDGRILSLREKNELFVLASIEELSIEANKAETPLRFGTGRHAFVVDGWIPVKDLARVKSELAANETGSVEVLDVGFEPAVDEPPIKLSNPKGARPMEMLIEMFSLPKYNEVDPTALMLITFPIFYGLMLGDWGYGIVLVALSISGAFKDLMGRLGMAGGAPGLNKILLYCGITSIAFGLVYDEFFGFELFHGWHIHFEFLGVSFPVYRAEESMVGAMLMFCVFIGVAHLLLGYAIGLYNVRAEHGLRTAILEKGGWILTLIGLVMFAVVALPNLLSGVGLPFDNMIMLSGIVLLVAGIIMTATVEKINGVLELPGLASNLLSYTRIFAIGLSSIGIALAFNEKMAMPAIEGGGAGIAVGVLILIMGHALNIGLGIIGPLIQSLRLHYVEFFTKFYKGGGVKFNPLSIRRKYTKEA